jgi:hypothetical protein
MDRVQSLSDLALMANMRQIERSIASLQQTHKAYQAEANRRLDIHDAEQKKAAASVAESTPK